MHSNILYMTRVSYRLWESWDFPPPPTVRFTLLNLIHSPLTFFFTLTEILFYIYHEKKKRKRKKDQYKHKNYRLLYC